MPNALTNLAARVHCALAWWAWRRRMRRTRTARARLAHYAKRRTLTYRGSRHA